MNTLDHPSLAPVTLPATTWRDIAEPLAAAPLTRAQWVARLEDHLPAAWVAAHCALVTLCLLRGDSPSEAAFYLRTTHSAPYLAPVDLPQWVAMGASPL